MNRKQKIPWYLYLVPLHFLWVAALIFANAVTPGMNLFEMLAAFSSALGGPLTFRFTPQALNIFCSLPYSNSI